MNVDARRLQSAIEVTNRAANRLRSSTGRYRRDLEQAIAAENVEDDPQLLLVLDSFVQRYQRLHEHMTHRLYPAIFRSEQLGERPPPMLRLLKWLEEQKLVDDWRAWGRYAEARNRLVHEYPLEAPERVEALQLALKYSFELLADLDRAIRHVERKGLLDD